jgi:hypothetical protein
MGCDFAGGLRRRRFKENLIISIHIYEHKENMNTKRI